MDIYQRISHFYNHITTEKDIIGQSVLGRNIYAVKIGCGRPTGIVQYAIHGREYVTAVLAEIHAALGLYTGSCWLIPLANPDGALLSQQGLSSVGLKKRQAQLLALNGGSTDFSLWKAFARGVDLNDISISKINTAISVQVRIIRKFVFFFFFNGILFKSLVY